MLHFTIRDLLWVTAIVAIATCWCLEHFAVTSRAILAEQRQAEMASEIKKLRRELLVHEERLTRFFP